MFRAPEASAGATAAPPTIAATLMSRPASLKNCRSRARKKGERSPIFMVPMVSFVCASARSHGSTAAPAAARPAVAAAPRNVRRVSVAKSIPTVTFSMALPLDDDG